MNQDQARILFLLMAVLLLGVTTDLVAPAEEELEATYIVQLEEAKIPLGGLIDRLRWYASFVGEGKPLMYAYKNVMAGFAARLTEAEVEAMRDVQGFVAAYPDAALRLHTSYSSRFLGFNPDAAKGLWPASGFGKGVIIGMLDSGVWPESPSFADLGMPPPPAKWKGICETAPDFDASTCNNKLIGARVFRKGSGDRHPTPRDADGHGTHTSSIAAGNRVPNASFFGYANGTAWGMASSAHLAIYKVCGDDFCFNSDILAGMDQAIADGVDVLSLSEGGSSQPLYADPIALGAFTAIQKGIFVSCSAGNSGPAHSMMENQAPWLMTVGASTMDRNFIATVKLGDGSVLFGESLYPGKGPTELLPLIHVRTESGNLCLNGSLNSSDIAGKMVVCERGVSSRVMKGLVVREAGGAGMILVADEASGNAIVADSHVLPATFVGYTAGIAIKTYINSTKTPTASINFQGTVFGTVDAPAVAGFSSRGPSSAHPEFLKPDVIAPGVNVLAAWPPEISPTGLPGDDRTIMFFIDFGTSMSCPHVSGLAALLKAAHADWSPAAIKSALMTMTDVLNKKGAPIRDSATNITADVFATGAGHVNPEKAANPGLIYDLAADDYIPYLCGLNYTAAQIRVIVNKNVTCPTDRETTLPGNLNYPSFSVLFQIIAAPTSKTFKRTVTNVGVANSTYIASIEAPRGMQVTVNPMMLSFQEVMEKKSYNITFTVPTSQGVQYSFAQGSLTWISNSTTALYQVRSPISITWYQ